MDKSRTTRTGAHAEVIRDQFTGYPPPVSNTTYTPNQFFDVVLPNASRGVVRLVAYMIRKSLGWCDEHGNPQEPHVSVSYNELIESAGIARSMIKSAVEEAIAARFITCLRVGRSNTEGALGYSSLFELCWDERESYVTDPDDFQGFFAGNGNLTYIPNLFFDYTIPNEPLAVVRVVGAIIRHTIGFQTRYGMRRQRVAMPYTELQRRTHLTPRSVSQALQVALEHNHIVRLEEGVFDPAAGQNSRPATYGIRWVDNAVLPGRTSASEGNGSKSIAGDDEPANGSKSIAEDSERFEKYSGDGSESIADERFERYSDIEIKEEIKDLHKQQQAEPAPLAAEDDEDIFIVLTQLKELGFDSKTARMLTTTFPAERVSRQIEWMKYRNAAKNRLGMLRKAIEEDWPKPVADLPVEGNMDNLDSKEKVFVAHFYAAWGGNDGAPVALPSPNDLQSASHYIDNLLNICPHEDQLIEWAKAFGAFVRNAEVENPRVLKSFVVAVRGHGDAFLTRFKAQQEEARKKALALAKQSHEAQFAEAYRAYLQGREDAMRDEQPETYEAFIQDTQKARQRYEHGPFASEGRLTTLLLTTFDKDESHVERLKTFCKEHKYPLYEFWEWDTQANQESFSEERVPGCP